MKKLDICLEILSFVLLLIILVVAIFGEGKANVPWYSLGIYTLLTLLSRFPEVHNYPVKVTAENREMLTFYSSRIVRWLKVFLLVIFMRMDGVILPDNIERPVVGLAMLATLGVAVYYLIKMIRIDRSIRKNKSI